MGEAFVPIGGINVFYTSYMVFHTILTVNLSTLLQQYKMYVMYLHSRKEDVKGFIDSHGWPGMNDGLGL